MAIILLTGPSATGKSTIAHQLGEDFQTPVLGEREVLRFLARCYGYPRTRLWLRRAGIDKVLDEALAETVRKVKEDRNERGIILDGSYDRRLPRVLRESFPEEDLIIVSIVAEQDTRRERMMRRMMASSQEALEEIRVIGIFKDYAGMPEIMAEANFTVDNGGPIEETLGELHSRLEPEFSRAFPGKERVRG